MAPIPTRVRVSAACGALAVLLAGCGAASGPSSTAPDTGQDLFQALPPALTPPPPPATIAPSPSPSVTRKPTPRAKPTTTSTGTGRSGARPTSPRNARSAAAPGATEGAGAAANPAWRQVGGDDFAGGSLDTGTWGAYDSVGAFGNGRRTPDAISQSDGSLKITARGDRSGGMAHSMSQLYGRWEFRARTAAGRGFGSAILLWPDSERFPVDGELDIMEVPGENRDLAHCVVHWGEDNNVNGGSLRGDFTQWHTFALEWLPDRITWYVDGAKHYENTDKAAIPTTPMHMTIQLDEGPAKDWIMEPDNTTPEEIALEVDWVKVSAL